MTAVYKSFRSWWEDLLHSHPEVRENALNHPPDDWTQYYKWELPTGREQEVLHTYLDLFTRTNMRERFGEIAARGARLLECPLELILETLRLPAPWDTGALFESLLVPRNVWTRDGWRDVHGVATLGGSDPQRTILEVLALMDPTRHARALRAVYLSTFDQPEFWPWPEIVGHIRSMANAWFNGYPWSGVVKSLRDARRNEDARHLQGEIKHPGIKHSRVRGGLKRLRPMILDSANRVGSVRLLEIFDEVYKIDRQIGEELATLCKRVVAGAMVDRDLRTARNMIADCNTNPRESVLAAIATVALHSNDRNELERNLFLKIDFEATLARQKAEREQALARQREEQQRLEAEREAEKERRRAHEALHRSWQERIADRCRAIVTVFNGVMGLEIDPVSLLSGEVHGSYASISSGGGMGIGLQMNIDLRQEIRYFIEAGTWLELEEGGDEAEWAKAYDAENFLIWHELAHLADGTTLRRLLAGVPEYRTLSEEEQLQARELVIDAVGLGLAEALYVHPDKGRHLRTSVTRQTAMLKALCVQTRRILDHHTVDAPADKHLLTRLRVELETFRTQSELVAPTLAALQAVLGTESGPRSMQRRVYEAVYAKARSLDPLKLAFHPFVQDLADDAEAPSNDGESESFAGAN